MLIPIYIYKSLHNFFLGCAFSIWFIQVCAVIDDASQDLHAFLQIKNILSHYSSFPIVCASFSYNSMCIQRNKVWCVFASPIVLNVCVIDIQMRSNLPLSICNCMIFHMTPTGNSRVVLSSNRRWNVCTKIKRQKLRIQKFAYDNNFILTYSEHNCVHSFYSFVYFYDAV